MDRMDKVNKDALKGKFKDRKDKDINNDGKVDSSDEYLHKRRQAISKAIDEAKKLSAKDMKNALASDDAKAKPKDKVSLKKAPWEMKKEEAELDEAKDNYTINHKTFSSAVQHAEEVVKKRGFEIDPEEWSRKVALGPKKPGKGKTNSYTIELMKDGKETKRKLQMQVYYDEGRYELNMYIS